MSWDLCSKEIKGKAISGDKETGVFGITILEALGNSIPAQWSHCCAVCECKQAATMGADVEAHSGTWVQMLGTLA